MAKITGNIFFTRTVGNICFYQVNDNIYVRSKSSLTRKRVLEGAEFASTRKYAGDLARASRIASLIYQALPVKKRGRVIFRAITREVASLLYEGMQEQAVKELLDEKYLSKE